MKILENISTANLFQNYLKINNLLINEKKYIDVQ